MELNFGSIKYFAKRYNNTITSTLWRIVEEREPECAVFGMISIHPHHPEIGQSDNGDIQYFIRSTCFKEQFANVMPEDAFSLLERHANRNKNGLVVNAQDALVDVNCETYEFRIESFSNSYALLTYGVCGIKTPMVSAI